RLLPRAQSERLARRGALAMGQRRDERDRALGLGLGRALALGAQPGVPREVLRPSPDGVFPGAEVVPHGRMIIRARGQPVPDHAGPWPGGRPIGAAGSRPSWRKPLSTTLSQSRITASSGCARPPFVSPSLSTTALACAFRS